MPQIIKTLITVFFLNLIWLTKLPNEYVYFFFKKKRNWVFFNVLKYVLVNNLADSFKVPFLLFYLNKGEGYSFPVFVYHFR